MFHILFLRLRFCYAFLTFRFKFFSFFASKSAKFSLFLFSLVDVRGAIPLRESKVINTRRCRSVVPIKINHTLCLHTFFLGGKALRDIDQKNPMIFKGDTNPSKAINLCTQKCD